MTSTHPRHLPDTLRHHPDTPQTPPYLACMRPLGERVISEYHDIYSTGLNLYDIYPPQTSAWLTQTPSRHPSETPIFDLHETTGRKSNIWIPWYLFNCFQFIWYLSNPDISQTCSDTFQTLPDTLRHHPDTPQKPPYLTCMRPLGERVISEYHNIYSTVFNFSDNCFTQTSVRHAQTLSRNCQTPSTPSRHPSNAPILL